MYCRPPGWLEVIGLRGMKLVLGTADGQFHYFPIRAMLGRQDAAAGATVGAAPLLAAGKTHSYYHITVLPGDERACCLIMRS